jgi:signal peptidase II
MNQKNLRRYKILAIISLTIIILDQLSKWLIFSFAKENIIIKKVKNTGAAFGMFKDSSIILGIIAILAIIFIIYYSKKAHKKEIIPLSLILGGAFGNLIDRLIIGYVRDFISIWIWPVFNIADSAITIGALLLIFTTLKKDKEKTNSDKKV